jgi:hypothetical protein
LTKPELGWRMIQHAQPNGVPFDPVVMDDLHGRNAVLRQRLNLAEIEYYGDIPANTRAYLDKPRIVYPLTKRGKPSKRERITAKQQYDLSFLDRRPQPRPSPSSHEIRWGDQALPPTLGPLPTQQLPIATFYGQGSNVATPGP